VNSAVADIKRGDQLFENYGSKCNYRFLLNYGFVYEDNDVKEYPLKIYYDRDDKLIQLKNQLVQDVSGFKKFKVVPNFDSQVMDELLQWLRLVVFND
jgi:histone-lysine N-methyltransferase SETD3